MADIDDVLNALVNLAVGALYPNGTSQPSVTGLPTVVYPGWPQSSQLDADMAGFAATPSTGRIHITVYPLPQEKVTTRYSANYSTPEAPSPTLALTLAGHAVTVSGTVTVPQNVGLVIDKKPYLYAVQATDTLASIATALAAQITGASAAGPIITIPASAQNISPRVGTTGTSLAMTKQQTRSVQMTVWADTPAHRSATAQVIDGALSNTRFLTLPDGTSGRLVYQSSPWDDMTQKANVYRRDLIYTVDYPTTVSASASQVLTVHETLGVSLPDGSVTPVLDTYF